MNRKHEDYLKKYFLENCSSKSTAKKLILLEQLLRYRLLSTDMGVFKPKNKEVFLIYKPDAVKISKPQMSSAIEEEDSDENCSSGGGVMKQKAYLPTQHTGGFISSEKETVKSLDQQSKSMIIVNPFSLSCPKKEDISSDTKAGGNKENSHQNVTPKGKHRAPSNLNIGHRRE